MIFYFVDLAAGVEFGGGGGLDTIEIRIFAAVLLASLLIQLFRIRHWVIRHLFARGAKPAAALENPESDLLDAVSTTVYAPPTGEENAIRVVGTILDAAQRFCGGTGAIVEVLDGDRLVRRAQSGVPPPYQGPAPVATSLGGLAIKSSQTLWINDAYTDPRLKSGVAVAAGYRSFLAAPLWLGDRALGALTVVASPPDVFSRSAAGMLTSVGRILAGAIWRGTTVENEASVAAQRDTAAAKAAAAEARLALITDRVREVCLITDAAGEKVEFVSSAYEAVWGRPTDTLYQAPRTWRDALVEEDRPRLAAAIEAAHKGEPQELTYRVQRPDREVRWVRARIEPLREGRRAPHALLHLVEDRSSELGARAEADALQRRLAFPMSESPVVAYAARPTGDYALTYVSPNVEKMLGYVAQDFVADPNFWTARLHPEEQSAVFADFPKLFEKGRLVHEYRFRHKDGTFRLLHDDMLLVRDDNGQAAEIVGFWLDITERRRMEEGVNYSLNRIKELQDARTRLLDTISHDLANPLTPVRLQLKILEETLGGKTGPHSKAMDILDRNVEQLARLIEDLKDVARLEGGTLKIRTEPGDLAEMARAAVETFQGNATERGVTLETKLAKSLPVTADAQRITQVLFNFLSNALKFTPQGGTIRVEAAKGGTNAIARVTDSGRGLTKEEMDRLFRPFSQVHKPGEIKERGTGLGLYISKGLIESHGGKIFVESQGHGKGSTFGFSLPLSGKSA